jgi:replicative DNA helicase
VISLEERRQQYIRKFVCAEEEVSLKKWMRGELNPEELERIKNWKDKSKKKALNRQENNSGWIKIFQVPAKEFSIQEIDNMIDKELGEEKIDVIIIDHLGLLKPIAKLGDKTYMEFGDTSKYIREMAARRNAVSLLLAQAGRSAIRIYKNKREVELNIENVESSNQPFQDSDTVFGISRDKDPGTNLAVVQILKQRDGEGDHSIKLLYDKEYCRYSDFDEMINISCSNNLDETVAKAKIQYGLITKDDKHLEKTNGNKNSANESPAIGTPLADIFKNLDE